MGAFLLNTYLREGSLSSAALSKRHDAASIAVLDASLSKIADRIEIDLDIAVRHPGISALGLQRLLEYFKSYAGDPENLLPAPSESVDAYDRFITVMRHINENVFPVFLPDGRVPLTH